MPGIPHRRSFSNLLVWLHLETQGTRAAFRLIHNRHTAQTFFVSNRGLVIWSSGQLRQLNDALKCAPEPREIYMNSKIFVVMLILALAVAAIVYLEMNSRRNSRRKEGGEE